MNKQNMIYVVLIAGGLLLAYFLFMRKPVVIGPPKKPGGGAPKPFQSGSSTAQNVTAGVGIASAMGNLGASLSKAFAPTTSGGLSTPAGAQTQADAAAQLAATDPNIAVDDTGTPVYISSGLPIDVGNPDYVAPDDSAAGGATVETDPSLDSGYTGFDYESYMGNPNRVGLNMN